MRPDRANPHDRDAGARLLHSVAASGGIWAAQVLLSLAIAVVMARAMEPGAFGIYSLALSIAAFLIIPAQLGLPTLLVREVARYVQAENWGGLRGLLRRVNQSAPLLAGFAGVIGLAIGWAYYARLGQSAFVLIAWTLLLVPLIAFTNLRAAALRGLQFPVQGQLPDLLRPLLVLVLSLFALMLGSLTPVRAVALNVFAAAIACATGAALLYYRWPSEARAAEPVYETRAWTRSLLPLSLTAGLQIANQHADILMLGLLGIEEDIGLFRIAAQCAMLISIPLVAINMAVAPRFARLHHAGEIPALQRLVTQVARILLVTSLPLAICLCLVGQPMLRMVFGEAFAGAQATLIILSLGQVVNAMVGPVASLLNMTGHERDPTWALGISIFGNIALGFALIPAIGAEGAAIASAISLAAWNVMLYRQVYLRIGINTAVSPLKPGRRC